MFVSVRMQLRNHVDTQPLKCFQGLKGLCDIYTVLFWNVASAREWDFIAQMVWWFCAVAQEGTQENGLFSSFACPLLVFRFMHLSREFPRCLCSCFSLPFNLAPVSIAGRFPDWGCVVLREIDFLFRKFADGFDCITFLETNYFNLSVQGLNHFRSHFITTCSLASFQVLDISEDFSRRNGIFCHYTRGGEPAARVNISNGPHQNFRYAI